VIIFDCWERKIVINPGSKRGITFKKLASMREMILLVIIVVLFAGMSVSSKYFLTPQNMKNLLMSFTVEGIIAIGMLLLLVQGGIDLSAGANMAFTGVVFGLFCTRSGLPYGICFALGLCVGLAVGLCNGFLIAFMGLNALITTLGTSMTFNGLMMMLTKGKAVAIPTAVKPLGQGTFLHIQYPVYILLALVIVFEILLRKMRIVRTSYYVGGNENAARLNGINVRMVKLSGYAITGTLAGLTGIVLSARLSTASVTVGGDTALRVITACIIGGASLIGGEGTILGAFLGVVFMQLVSSSLNILGVDVYVKTFVTGLILVAAIMVDVLNERRKVTKMTTDAQKQLDAEA
jgi:ribose transport system permease protein